MQQDPLHRPSFEGVIDNLLGKVTPVHAPARKGHNISLAGFRMPVDSARKHGRSVRDKLIEESERRRARVSVLNTLVVPRNKLLRILRWRLRQLEKLEKEHAVSALLTPHGRLLNVLHQRIQRLASVEQARARTTVGEKTTNKSTVEKKPTVSARAKILQLIKEREKETKEREKAVKEEIREIRSYYRPLIRKLKGFSKSGAEHSLELAERFIRMRASPEWSEEPAAQRMFNESILECLLAVREAVGLRPLPPTRTVRKR